MNSRASLFPVRLRAALLVLVSLPVAAGALLLAGDRLAGALSAGAAPVGHRVVEGASVVLGLGTAWLAVLVLASAAPLLRRPALPTSRVPRRVRAAVLLVCGVGVALPAPGAAAERPGPAYGEGAATAVLLDGLRLPDRLAGPERRPLRTHHVRPGDTLWDLARTTLPATADDTAVAQRWRAIYAANRAAVGADPHLLQIGTRLTLPARPLGKARP